MGIRSHHGIVADLGRRALGRDTPGTLFDDALEAVCLALEADAACFVTAPGPDTEPELRAGYSVVEPADYEAALAPDGSPKPTGAASARVVARGVHVGNVVVHRSEPEDFEDDEHHFLASIANVIATAIQRSEAQDRIARLGMLDPLTGLANRVMLQDHLDRAVDRLADADGAVAVLFCDLDRFKLVNDGLGHDAGDRLLVDVAERLRAALEPGELLGRFGGDEFVLISEETAGHDDAVAVADRIALRMAAQPFFVGGVETDVSFSIGIAVAADPDVDPSSLLRDADIAMYRAKDAGRGRNELFDSELRESVIRRVELGGALRRALERGELYVVYQPEVEITGSQLWVEALLRWRHPKLGSVSPDEFIRVAEETGAIIPIGDWVLQTATRQFAEWQAAAPQAAPSTISVNISARQLASEDITDRVQRALEAAAIPPEALWLEITETATINHPERTIARLRELSDLGVGLAIDDFGTGYSSLTYARRLPASALKIDRSFVSGSGPALRDESIAVAIINLAHSLDLLAIAEGVETPEQLGRLRRLGCDFGQGYLWSRPLDPDALIEWARTHYATLHADRAS